MEPTPPPTAAATPVPTHTPNLTAAPTSEPTPQPTSVLLPKVTPTLPVAVRQTIQPKSGDLEALAGWVASSDNPDLQHFMGTLSESERSCLAASTAAGSFVAEGLRTFLEEGAASSEMREVVPCLSDASRSSLMIIWWVANSDSPDLQHFMGSLSEPEHSCLAAADAAGSFVAEEIRTFLEEGTASYKMREVVPCLSDASVSSLMIMGMNSSLGPLSDATKTCLSDGLTGIDLRNVLTGANEQALMVHGSVSLVIALSCLNDAEWQSADSFLDIDIVPQDQQRLNCMVQYFGSPQKLATALRPTTKYVPEALFEAMLLCGVPGEDRP